MFKEDITMLNIYVCVGSSCHLKGSPKIVKLFQEAIAAHGLGDRVNLAASFCLGKCAEGVSIRVGEEIITGVSPENFSEIFSKYVLEALK